MAAKNVLSKVAVEYDKGKSAGIFVSEQVPSVLKVQHQQMSRLAIEENDRILLGLCEGGERKVLSQVYYAKKCPTVSIYFTRLPSRACIRIVFSFPMQQTIDW